MSGDRAIATPGGPPGRGAAGAGPDGSRTARPGAVHLAVDRVRITGAPAGISPASLRAAIARGLERALAAPARAGDAGRSPDLPRLELRLPPGAGEADIAEAVARAIAARAPRRERVTSGR